MTLKRLKRSFFLCLTVFTFSAVTNLTSCVSPQKVVYFNQQAADSVSSETLRPAYNPTFRPGDVLEVIVTTTNKDITELANLQPTNPGNVGFETGTPAPGGYLVTTNGTVDLPIVGSVQVGGKTREEVTQQLKTLYSEYGENPIIQIRILNFKVTVLGDVANPRAFNVPNERMTLLEAIGVAGDLNITANRKNILVIREENNVKTETRIDLTTNDVFKSPVYFLQQNDVVYVEPNRVKMNTSQYSPIYSVLLTVTTLVVTTISVIVK